jgi:GT2 family glycosyltransferase
VIRPRPLIDHVSVVIPTIGRDLLQGSLESILRGTVWPREVIVVDQSRNSGVDRCIRVLRSEGLRVEHVRAPQKGIAAATNRGLELAATPYVAITHDDCRVRPDWLEKLSARVRTGDDAILTGRVEPEGEGLVLTVVTSEEPAIYTTPMIDRDVLFPPNMGFPVRLLDQIGYFDEHPSLSLAGEDNEWAYRALSSGVPIVYDPEIVVAHLAWQHPAALRSLYRRYSRGQWSFYGKYLRRGDTFILRRALRDLLRAPWLLLRGAVTANPELLEMGIGEVMGLLPGLLAGLRNAGDRLPAPSPSHHERRQRAPRQGTSGMGPDQAFPP